MLCVIKLISDHNKSSNFQTTFIFTSFIGNVITPIIKPCYFMQVKMSHKR
jgi:hypothetical protein